MSSLRRLLIVILSLCALLAAPSGAAAQGPPQFASVTGKVFGPDGEPVSAAVVLVASRSGGQPRPGRTDAKGAYTVPYLAAGPYRLTATHPGYADATVDVVLVENETAKFDLELGAGTTRTPVAVGSGKTPPRPLDEAVQHVHVTSEDEIERKRHATTADAVDEAPDVQHAGGNPVTQTPIVRGMPGQRSAVVVDGDRLSNQRVSVTPSVVAPSDVQAAEVTAGGASNLEGSGTLGGVVYLTTKAPPRANTGHLLGLELDGGYRTNGDVRDGSVAILFSTEQFAARLSGTLFRQGDYAAGAGEIAAGDVLAVGELVALTGTSPAAYPVFSFPDGGLVPSSAAHGSYDLADVRFFPAPKHTLRYGQLNSHHYDIGQPFGAPPYNTVSQWNDFRRYDKYSLRYQGTGLERWLGQLTASVYGQRLAVPQDALFHAVVPGSSYATGPTGVPVFTGGESALVPVGFTENRASVRDIAAEVFASLTPFKSQTGLTFVVGYAFLHESSDDEFTQVDLSPAFPPLAAAALDTGYQNNAVYGTVTYDRLKRVHATAGVRFDHWHSEAEPPAAAGAEAFETDRSYASPHAGIAFPLAFGLTPFANWSLSFREPAASEQYPATLFASPSKAALPAGLDRLEPERSNSVAAGATFSRKVAGATVFAMGEYFYNRVRNFNIQFGESPVPGQQSPGSASPAGKAASPLDGLALNRVVIQGAVGTYRVGVPLGRAGSVSPYGNILAMRGRNDTPPAPFVGLVEALYDRPGLPVVLEGSAEDFPLGFIGPLDATFGATYASPKGRWTLDYSARHVARVERVDPVMFFLGPTVSYATFASLAPFTVQNLQAGYLLMGETTKVRLTAGVENLANRFYWEHFQFTPAPGRSVTFGVSVDLANLLAR